MACKPTFLYGLGERKHWSHLDEYFEIPDIDWNTGTITPPIVETDVLVGFSMGAIAACDYALENRVNHLILCSMTTGVETLKNINAGKITFLIGEKERWVITDTERLIKDLSIPHKLVTIKGADHEIDNNYLRAILNELNDGTEQ